MTETVPMTEVPSDLPPRTWHGWWLDRPKWLRIGVWAGLGVFGVNLIVGTRIYQGLSEPAEIAALRARGATVVYQWEESRDFSHWGFARMQKLLQGHFCSSVVSLAISNGTDADLELIGHKFPKLRSLSFGTADISLTGIAALQKCSRLKAVYLWGTNCDDHAVLELMKLKHLRELSLNDTLITDVSLSALMQREFTYLDTHGTDMTLAATSQLQNQPKDDASFAYNDLFSIRWSDGTRTVNFFQPILLVCNWREPLGPLTAKKYEQMVTLRHRVFFRYRSERPSSRFNFWVDSDSKIQAAIRIGQYESEPILFVQKYNVASAHRLEFQMPCTKSEALRSVQLLDSRADHEEQNLPED